MATGKLTRFEQELGKALCDRLGLVRNSTLLEWNAEGDGETVLVTMKTAKVIPVREYHELLAVASRRAMEVVG